MTDHILGILGGMGPEATAYFFQQFIKATPANNDLEHIKTIIYSNPQIPDRTQAILYDGISPVEEMIRTARVLEKSGADFIFMPCFTAHHFVEQVQDGINTPVINLLHIVKEYIEVNHSNIKSLGILCTTGTKRSKIFDDVLYNYQLIYPDEEMQENYVMKAIYGEKGIKAGYADGISSQLLNDAGQELKNRGAEILVMGCTEIPLALKEDALDIPILNPMKLAAHYLVKRIKG